MRSTMMAAVVPAILSCCCLVRSASSQSGAQMLKSASPSLEREFASYPSKRAEEVNPSTDYLANLWAAIEEAYKFLEEVELWRKANDKTSQSTSDLKQKKINQLPYTRHNFVRFGKRFVQDLDTNKSEMSEDAIVVKLQEILNRLKDSSYVKPGSESYEIGYPVPLARNNEAENSDGYEKRELHKFVRIGKSYLAEATPLQPGVYPIKDVTQESLGKRIHSKFVRIG